MHKDKALVYKGVLFYAPVYCAFGGEISPAAMANDLLAYAQLATPFFVVGNPPQYNAPLSLSKELVCLQMVLACPIDLKLTEEIVLLESKEHKKALFNLVNLVQPGFFREQTADLGRYYGLFKDQQLVAVCGERMKMNNFTEISAIVTHPDYTGKGYAKQLIKKCTDQVFLEHKTPYLHVLASNIPAISLYEKLGFSTRREISFWQLIST